MVDEKDASREVHEERTVVQSQEHIGDKVSADADAGRAEEARRRESDQSDLVAAEQRADDAEPPKLMTAAEAKVMLPVAPADAPASDHFAQKFGNDPANPKPADGLQLYEVDDDGKHVMREDVEGVRLSRVTPDHAEPVYTHCHPEMVGDYLRAGWNRA